MGNDMKIAISTSGTAYLGSGELPELMPGESVSLFKVNLRKAYLEKQIGPTQEKVHFYNRQSDRETAEEFEVELKRLKHLVKLLNAIKSKTDVEAYNAYLKEATK